MRSFRKGANVGKPGFRKGVLVGVPGGKFAKEDRSCCESQARKLDLIQKTLRVLLELWFRISNLIACAGEVRG